TTTPTPTATQTESDTPAADPPSCEDVLTADGYAKLAADTLTLRDATPAGPVVTEMIAQGALGCTWVRPAAAITASYAQLNVGADQPRWEARLAESGWTPAPDIHPNALVAPVGYDPAEPSMRPTVTFEHGILYFNSPSLNGMIRLPEE